MATFDEVRGTIEAANERYVEASARFSTTYYNVMHDSIDDISRVDMTKVVSVIDMCTDIINICSKLMENQTTEPESELKAVENDAPVEPEVDVIC